MAASQDITAKPLSDITSEQTRDSRARAWAFAFDCYSMKKGSRPGAPEDEKERSVHDSLASENYTG